MPRYLREFSKVVKSLTEWGDELSTFRAISANVPINVLPGMKTVIQIHSVLPILCVNQKT